MPAMRPGVGSFPGHRRLRGAGDRGQGLPARYPQAARIDLCASAAACPASGLRHPPPRLIERGKFACRCGRLCCWQFLYGRPSRRLLQDLAGHGLTSHRPLAGGCRPWAPLFEPLNQALQGKLRSEAHWHVRRGRAGRCSSRCRGKVGHRWYLWCSTRPSVVPLRARPVAFDRGGSRRVQGVKRGIISCDRYAAYKRFARLNPGVVLAFCWSHQRRDYLEAGHSYPLCCRGQCSGGRHWRGLPQRAALRPRTAAPSASSATRLQKALQRMTDERDVRWPPCLPNPRSRF